MKKRVRPLSLILRKSIQAEMKIRDRDIEAKDREERVQAICYHHYAPLFCAFQGPIHFSQKTSKISFEILVLNGFT